MARISPKLNPLTLNPKISALLAWVLMLLMGVGVISMVVVGMAGGKKKVTAKRARGGGSNRASEIEEEEEEIDAESQNSARMPFPCMISKICKSQKVRGPRFAHLEPLKPGALDASFVSKSKSQSHDPPSPKRKGKMAEMTKTPGPRKSKTLG
ncbi:hypothetical protein RHGRI_027307 [Rhododendron griersonianum]|uniref:Uncharacterized protein n=1 Tax=Rhododendron griersonianum TaxID=479676 RepID=A0AAV6IW68_9ERIC|nr:hypothetical protein RHGRI_027307 [Rhododendron griersonianum]